MFLELAANFLVFFVATTAGASALGIAVDKGVTWYRGEEREIDR